MNHFLSINSTNVFRFASSRLGLATILGIACMASPTTLSLTHAESPASESKDSKGVSLFDGKSLAGWKGLAENWSVQDGAITGVNTAENPVKNNTFLVYEKPFSDFELVLKFRIQGGNSGVQYRSKLIDAEKFIVGGYQADIDASGRYMGINYEERGRGILAERGEVIAIDDKGSKSKAESCGDPEELKSKIKMEDWNEYRIVAKGSVVQHFINGSLMSEVRDSETAKRASEGIIAFQVHAGPPMKVQFKDIVIHQ
ncbi:MAG: DUF1080 domain-containing protein [bacterium]|jgi:hypothetical protein